MSERIKALRKLINERLCNSEIKEIYADSIPEYRDPDFISCELPDIIIKYVDGRQKIIKVYEEPMSSHEEYQHKLFEDLAKMNPKNTTYEYYLTKDLV